MTKPQLVKVEALFYVLQQVIKRSCAYFDTAPFLDALKSGKFLSLSRLKQQVRRLMGMYMPCKVDALAFCALWYTISA